MLCFGLKCTSQALAKTLPTKKKKKNIRESVIIPGEISNVQPQPERPLNKEEAIIVKHHEK